MHFNASRSLTQTLLDCILYLTLTQYFYDPDTLPSSANQCILGTVYLRSNQRSLDSGLHKPRGAKGLLVLHHFVGTAVALGGTPRSAVTLLLATMIITVDSELLLVT